MSFLPLYRDKKHKFENGSWTWGEHETKLKFHPHGPTEDDKKTKTHSMSVDAGLKFAAYIDEVEEKIFREVFQRPDEFCDSDVVTLQDIKNLALFTLRTKVPQKLIKFFHVELFDKFLHSVIFYTDLYLLILEFLMIRRDKEAEGFIRDSFSTKVEQFLSKQLSDRRLLIAREHSKVKFANCT